MHEAATLIIRIFVIVHPFTLTYINVLIRNCNILFQLIFNLRGRVRQPLAKICGKICEIFNFRNLCNIAYLPGVELPVFIFYALVGGK